MKKLILSAAFISLLICCSVTALLAQSSSLPHNISLHNFVPNNISKPQSNWDIKFLYYASLSNTDKGNAGATYIPNLKEVWTSHWNSSKMYRWTAHPHGTSGVLDSVYTFTINGVSNVRGMTFDGNYVYAVNNSDTIFKINPSLQSLVGRLIVPSYSIRYITFDPTADKGKGGFWIGNFATDVSLIDYNGAELDYIPYDSLGTTVIYGAAFDNFSPNGPFLWVFGQTSGYTYPQVISQVDIMGWKPTGLKRVVNQDFTAYTDSALAGGLFFANDLVQGKLILGGIVQCPEKDLLFGYEVGSINNTPVSFTLNKSYSFGDPKLSSSYRIVSLPGDVSILAGQLMNNAGEQKKDWDIFYDNGKTENYLVEYNNSSDFIFKPGKAFWALSRNPFSINQQVNSVSSSLVNGYFISLHEGWNLIADPFNSEVSWNDIKTVNGLANNELIYAWTGSWSNPTTMQPYEGYYYNNINNLSALKIPLPGTLGKIAKENNIKLEKSIKISLQLFDKEYSSAYASVKQGSDDSFDQFDYFIPPSDFSELSISIYNDALKTPYKNLFIDSRPSINEGQQYKLNLKNLTGKEATLMFSGMSDFQDYEICLLDGTHGKLYDLKENPIVMISPLHEKSEMVLLIGNKNFVEEKRQKIVPSEFALSNNYPNPFNPSTVIGYELPERSQVELKIYDALGREITTLVKEEQSAGRYEIMFHAENFSSGVYFYSLRAGKFFKTKKMLLVR
ncbi:MAG: T9SS type A sorting domain-containing protein [Bacteroidota bacterium]|nr:T9SS type A sorting domain-containing protein [Bacteroidota bacterium]MDP4189949.1 T9SS type A sorting domain-containing protein [Bacteroidota bacterium]MDP4194494.1 T9SS type A sorting domain-containing protein [Bacteroidota bacterium]